MLCIPRPLIDQSVVEKAEANLKEITHTLEVVTKKVWFGLQLEQWQVCKKNVLTAPLKLDIFRW